MYSKKIIFSSIFLLLVPVFLFLNFNISSVSANPDYICKKSVENSACIINSCGAWNNGSRICYGTKTTQVSYYLIRTTCEAGYTQVAKGGNVGGASGRNSSDYVSGTSSCTITQYDNINPSGFIGQQ